MRVNSPPQLPAILVPAAAGPAPAHGQILQARVLAAPRDGPGAALLEISGQALHARSQVLLRAGEVLTVRVGLERARLVLAILARDPPGVVARALRAALPRQGPIATPFNTLLALQHTPQPAPARHPSAPAQAALRALAALPDLKALLQARGVALAVSNSGLFLESKLAAHLRPPPAGGAERQPAAAPGTRLAQTLSRLATAPSALPAAAGAPGAAFATDLKAVLLRLLATLRSEPRAPPAGDARSAGSGGSPPPPAGTGALARVAGQAEAALATLHVNQLHALQNSDGAPALWHIELPVRIEERLATVELSLERERSEATRIDIWSVMLTLRLDELGPLHARIRLSRGTVSTRLWAERRSTARLVGERLAELRQRLAAAGLGVGTLSCCHGAPPPSPRRGERSGLLHVRV